MNTQQLGGCDWLAPVLLNQQTQFFPCVDAAWFRASLYQRSPGVLVLAKEDRLRQRCGVHHDKGETEQGQEMPFMDAQCVCELWGATGSRLKRERVWWFNPEL
jgi:hypothetical protein